MEPLKIWLLSTYSVSNSLIESKSIKDRIILEDIPSGHNYLDSIIDAMKKESLYTHLILQLLERRHKRALCYASLRKTIPAALVYGWSFVAIR